MYCNGTISLFCPVGMLTLVFLYTQWVHVGYYSPAEVYVHVYISCVYHVHVYMYVQCIPGIFLKI